MNTQKDKDLRTRERYTNSFDIDLLAALKKLSKETMIPVSRLLDKSIELLLKEYDKR
ncbi:ribbon-helix-helix domain-containing protein [Clostridium brassicae]|uniref:Ribbon-helix-helix domain-containing protein n=1 Tax=Clostridium brassicae TaxID=2999072 RepID=A0ABT4D9D7_9CLOT|nr:ribbon-helix-helix domain-containing protein [Clostridium brassicae]MCY6958895.1 ribbon-helix-helix domain-containing protein [Clostridium brassicae]